MDLSIYANAMIRPLVDDKDLQNNKKNRICVTFVTLF